MRSTLLWTTPFLLYAATFALAQDPDASEAAAARRFQERAKKVVGQYVLVSGEVSEKLVRIEEPLLRWSNPLGGQKAHGEVYLWTEKGRPAAALSLYELTRPEGVVEHHEWISLSLSGVSAKGPAAWSPEKGGIEFQPLADVPQPAETARGRLSQMRELAGRFSAEKTTRGGEKRPLRLLSQPLFRYPPDEPPSADGALFSFVEATDPEAFLLIESRGRGDQRTWQYALARMTNVKLEVRLGEKVIWQVDTLPWSEAVERPDRPYSAFAVERPAATEP